MNDDRPSALCDGVLPLFYQLARTIALGDELQGVMDAAVKVIVENLAGAERVVLSVLNRRTGAAFIENAWGLTDEERSKGVYRMGEGITGYVVQTGDSLVVPNIAEEPAFLDRTGARRDVDTSRLAFICVPVKLGREVLGTLSVGPLQFRLLGSRGGPGATHRSRGHDRPGGPAPPRAQGGERGSP